MIKHIAFTMYPMADMARARRFYEDTLGLRLMRREASEFEWVEYDLDGGTFVLTDLKQEGHPAPKPEGVSPSKSRMSIRWWNNYARRGCA